MGEPHWTLDATRRPLVVLRVADADGVRAPRLESIYETGERLLALRERIVVVHDFTNAKPDNERRELTIRWVRENKARLDLFAVAYAVYTPNAFLRGVFVAATWAIGPKIPVEAFGSLAAAEAWALGHAEKAGLVRPPR